MDPNESPEELILRVHFYGVRSRGELCMAAVKKLIAFAREKDLQNVAQVLESAYVDDCNSSFGNYDELEEIKQRMPSFMSSHGMAIKALAWTGEKAPEELSADGMINVAGYSWDPVTDRMKIMTPKIFHGEKKKGRFTPETVFFEGEVNMENIINFYKGKSITHATILSKTASLYDPMGFIAPLKVYMPKGSY